MEKPHLERKERLTGNLADPSGAGGEMSARFKRLRVKKLLFSGCVGHSTSPDQQSQPETLKKTQKTTFLSQTESI